MNILTITFNDQEVSILLGAIRNTLNVLGQQLQSNPNDTVNNPNIKQMMNDLEALQSKLMNTTWTNN